MHACTTYSYRVGLDWRSDRDDISDNLYRIAPLNGRTTLSYRNQIAWTALEGVLYADQDDVPDTNRELKSDSYGPVNLSAGIRLARYLSLSAGVENLFDKQYADHLTGININRASGPDVAVGERLPGREHNYFATLELSYD